jgi:hypothetical protein
MGQVSREMCKYLLLYVRYNIISQFVSSWWIFNTVYVPVPRTEVTVLFLWCNTLIYISIHWFQVWEPLVLSQERHTIPKLQFTNTSIPFIYVSMLSSKGTFIRSYSLQLNINPKFQGHFNPKLQGLLSVGL